LLIVIALLAVRARNARTQRLVLLATLSAVGVASLVTSIIWTNQMPASAYFVTPTRMWEFAAGGILAFFPTVLASQRPAVRSLLSLVGFVAIAVSALTFTGSMA